MVLAIGKFFEGINFIQLPVTVKDEIDTECLYFYSISSKYDNNSLTRLIYSNLSFMLSHCFKTISKHNFNVHTQSRV